ncbi:MAG: tetratricopeptide repeat protein, partial [Deltaproteobacteria bacterium]|nr:tetratricopeptide repeat protein [Deltaproteobacteria bacterium]
MQLSKKITLIAFLALLAAGQAMAELSPQDAGAFGMAQSLNNAGRYAEAVPVLEKLYEQNPGRTDIALEYARALGFGKYPDRALQVLSGLDAHTPDDGTLVQLRASILEANSRFAEARDSYAKLLAQRPGDAALMSKLADLSFWLKDYPAAISWYEKAGLDPAGDPARAMNCADSLLAVQRSADAAALYRRISAAHPDDRRALPGFARSLQAAGNLTEARSLYLQLAQQSPDDPEPAVALADISYGLKDYPQAE